MDMMFREGVGSFQISIIFATLNSSSSVGVSAVTCSWVLLKLDALLPASDDCFGSLLFLFSLGLAIGGVG